MKLCNSIVDVVQNGNTAAMIALERNDQGSAKAVIMAAKGNLNAVRSFFSEKNVKFLKIFTIKSVLFRLGKQCSSLPARGDSSK